MSAYKLQSLASLSPKEDQYVEVVTPVHSTAASAPRDGQQDAYQCCDAGDSEWLDSSGLRMYAWKSDLSERGDLAAPYFWFACCLPCLAVPQLEVRMGVSSFKCAVLSCLVSHATLVGLWLLLAASLWSHLRGKGDSLQWTLLLVVFAAAQTIVIASRIASLRGRVRARYAIPGADKRDIHDAVLHPTHTVFQMAKHLGCERVRPCSVPTTLPAYEV